MAQAQVNTCKQTFAGNITVSHDWVTWQGQKIVRSQYNFTSAWTENNILTSEVCMLACGNHAQLQMHLEMGVLLS